MRKLKARYGAVKNTTKKGCNAKKTNKQTVKQLNKWKNIYEGTVG
jgi:hypothetical protein